MSLSATEPAVALAAEDDERARELDLDRADRAGGADDEYPLPRLHVAVVAQRLHGHEGRVGQDGSLLERQLWRFRRDLLG